MARQAERTAPQAAPKIMLAQLAAEFHVPLKVLQTACRYGAIEAEKVSGFYWAADRESVRRFVRRKRKRVRQGTVDATE